MPNSREWALLYWFVVLLVVVGNRRELRESFGQVVRLAFSGSLLALLAGLLGWVALEAWLGSRARLWDVNLITATCVWFVTTGAVLFYNVQDVFRRGRFFRTKAVAVLRLSSLVEFYLNLYVLGFVAELFLQPFLAFLAMLQVVAGLEDRHRSVKGLVDRLMALIGLVFLGYVLARTMSGWRELDAPNLLRQLLLPVWMTVGLLPYIYLVGLYAAYELAFQRIDWKAAGQQRLPAKLALLTSFHVRARDLRTFAGPWQMRISAAATFREARDVIREFRQQQRPTS